MNIRSSLPSLAVVAALADDETVVLFADAGHICARCTRTGDNRFEATIPDGGVLSEQVRMTGRLRFFTVDGGVGEASVTVGASKKGAVTIELVPTQLTHEDVVAGIVPRT
jgi:hypothetical protein